MVGSVETEIQAERATWQACGWGMQSPDWDPDWVTCEAFVSLRCSSSPGLGSTVQEALQKHS